MVAQVSKEYRRFGLGPTVVRLLSYALFEGRPITTRGRWINPLVFSLANSIVKLPLLGKVEKPIFIIGMGRSGTTILGTALSLHSNVGFLNEPKALWYTANPKDDLIGNFGSSEGQYLFGKVDASADVVERFQKLYSAYLRIVRRSRVVDKYPDSVFRIPYILECFPDAKFVLLLRNGRDTVASVKLWCDMFGRKFGGRQHDWWGVDNRKWLGLVRQVAGNLEEFDGKESELLALSGDSDKAAVEWVLTMHYAHAQQKKYSDQIKTVRFETLASMPYQTIGEILDFCELDREEAPLQFAERNLKTGSVRTHVHQPLSPLVRDAFDRMTALTGY